MFMYFPPPSVLVKIVCIWWIRIDSLEMIFKDSFLYDLEYLILLRHSVCWVLGPYKILIF